MEKSAIVHLSPTRWCLVEFSATLLSRMPNQVGIYLVARSVNRVFYVSAFGSNLALAKEVRRSPMESMVESTFQLSMGSAG